MNRFPAPTLVALAALLFVAAASAEDTAWEPNVFPHLGGEPPNISGIDLDCGTAAESCHQPFGVKKPSRSYGRCPDPYISWQRTDGCPDCTECPQCDVPALVPREAKWYAMADIVPLTRDSQRKVQFARRGFLLNTTTALSSQDLDYTFDAGGHFLLGRRLTERLSVEGSYLGSYGWSDSAFVRNTDFNILAGTGNLFSPFSNFGVLPVLGLDFNNFVQLDTSASFNNAELNLRYRPDFVCGPYDVSFLYGLRFIHVDETLRYRTASSLPAALGAVNDVRVGTENDLFGGQIGLSSHILLTGRCWLDVDLKGGIFTNQADQDTTYLNVDNTGATTTFLTAGSRKDTAFAGDVRLISNYQIARQWTVQLGYQVTWVNGLATAVDNFQRNIDLLRLGPGDIRTSDTVAYHGPVLGVTWVR